MTPEEDKPHIVSVLMVLVGLALALFVLLGISGVFDSGNVPGKECFDYKAANGDWLNSCD